MKITFERVSKITISKNESNRGNLKMSVPVEGPYGGEIEFNIKNCDFDFTNDGILIKKIYAGEIPSVTANGACDII